MAERRVVKVKDRKGKIEVAYELERTGDDPDQVTVRCGDAPHPEFRKALDDLRPHVAEICELSKAWSQNLDICGVSLSYAEDANGDPVLGATITAMKPLGASHGPLVINTPHKPERPYSGQGDDSEEFCLSGECAEVLEEVIRQALAYVDGRRAQGMFGFAAEEPEAVGAKG
ncbi:MAG TPA: hypothetical protein VM219_08875 [Phycisphaerae bacterium]|nr:hypothetical protein [Phycisphaerae bacterium]HUX03019.1 hypothetical protein [Phycisphaerae bacterium]